MKNILLLLFSFISISQLNAQNQGHINGVVKNKNTQETLPGVVIVINGAQSFNTATDENGTFSFKVPVGKYNLETSYIGFKPFTTYNINLSSGNAQVIEIELEENYQALDGVEISAAKSARATDMITPIATQLLTAEEIKVNPG